MKNQSTFFIGHVLPMVAADCTYQVRDFLLSFKEDVLSGLRPKGIVLVSAHWDTSQPAVTSNPHNHRTIYDFEGFPDSMYKIKYPAPGAPELAKKVKELLTAGGFGEVHEDEKRGLDHGAWAPLMLMYPEADVPVCQLSVQSNRSGTYHYEMGRALSPLKDEGYLIIGSGAATHNLEALHPSTTIDSWALQFDSWLQDALLSGRYEDVNQYEEKAPNAKTAHPWPEHFYPLHVAMGAAGENSKAQLIHHSWIMSGLSLASYKFVAPN